MKKIILANSNKIIASNTKFLKQKLTNSQLRVIGMFDLSGSTSLKMTAGQDVAIQRILFHNNVCKSFIEKVGGMIIKNLGDGVLAIFYTPLDACIAAINIRNALKPKNCLTKIALTLGSVEEMIIQGKMDVLGSAADLCSRIEKYAFPNQILIHSALHDAVFTHLKGYSDVLVSNPFSVIIDGKKNELYEITSKGHPLMNQLKLPFRIKEEGRLTIEEKVSFIQSAKKEIIEIGTGLKTFSDYFHSRNPDEFKNHVMKLVSKKISFKCYAVDPDWAIRTLHLNKNERKYFERVSESLNQLKDIKSEFRNAGIKGSFEVYVYKQYPFFHAVCVDKDSQNGRMIISNYMNNVEKSACPVLQFSKASNHIMYKTYLTSINKIILESKLWK